VNLTSASKSCFCSFLFPGYYFAATAHATTYRRVPSRASLEGRKGRGHPSPLQRRRVVRAGGGGSNKGGGAAPLLPPCGDDDGEAPPYRGGGGGRRRRGHGDKCIRHLLLVRLCEESECEFWGRSSQRFFERKKSSKDSKFLSIAENVPSQRPVLKSKVFIIIQYPRDPRVLMIKKPVQAEVAGME